MGEMLPIQVSDTAATGQDGLFLELVAATSVRECNIQDARGGGLWHYTFQYIIMYCLALYNIALHFD